MLKSAFISLFYKMQFSINNNSFLDTHFFTKEDTIEKTLEHNRIYKHDLTQIFYEDALKSN